MKQKLIYRAVETFNVSPNAFGMSNQNKNLKISQSRRATFVAYQNSSKFSLAVKQFDRIFLVTFINIMICICVVSASAHPC